MEPAIVRKKAKMRQNRKLPGQNPFTGQNNVPKSDSRTQMLRSGSNETDGKARDLKTGLFTNDRLNSEKFLIFKS